VNKLHLIISLTFMYFKRILPLNMLLILRQLHARFAFGWNYHKIRQRKVLISKIMLQISNGKLSVVA